MKRREKENLVAREKVRSVDIRSEFGDTARSHNCCEQIYQTAGEVPSFCENNRRQVKLKIWTSQNLKIA